jgi:two-component system, OmpR family, sensor histidine kinase KdpD
LRNNERYGNQSITNAEGIVSLLDYTNTRELIQKKIFPMVSRYVAAILCIAATTLILKPLQPHLDIQIIALLYLLPIMISTVLWGLTPGVLAGFIAFLVFNYFHIQPYNTFLVHQTQDVITLIIFLVVAVVLSQFIGQARAGTHLARSREWEATRMYELISALSGLKDTESIAGALADHTLEAFHFERVEIMISAQTGEEAFVTAIPTHQTRPSHPSMVCPMETARGIEGEIHIWHNRTLLSSQETRLLEAFTSQGALSIERVRLAKGESKARILEESDRLKSSLLNSVSHELRTPLAAIKASASSLRSRTVQWETAAREDLLATIEEETDQLNSLVGNLLDMSRIESGALNPQKQWNSIDEIAIGVAAKMRKKLENHEIEMDFQDNLPLVPTDYIMIGQVFINLISNSIKYAPADTTIFINAYQEGEYLQVEIANQGPPVPEEHLERIFDKFYRVTEAERVTGTGLGLSICKGIIKAHGGDIWAENRPNLFVFHFTLPLTLNGSLPDIPKEAMDE